MMRIVSKCDPNIALAVAHVASDCAEPRIDLCDPIEPLQVSILNYEGKVPAHRHFELAREEHANIQECWIVLSGTVEVSIYDIDNQLVTNVVLGAGDVMVSLRGAHALNFGEGSKVVEIKTGPYRQQHDKYKI